MGFPALKEEKDQNFPESQRSKANISQLNQNHFKSRTLEMKEEESSSTGNNNQAGAAVSSGNRMERKAMTQRLSLGS